MSNILPKIAIGLPVYNGERFVRLAIESLLAQTWQDFEIIVSDNGSFDATEKICRRLATHDSRIRYIRHDENRGAAWNFNFVFNASRSPYFKWAACDDLHAPEFLQRCYEALERDEQAVLAFTGTDYINAHGRIDSSPERMATFASRVPSHRLREAICSAHACLDVFGLIRRDVLARTRGLGSYASSDRVLLAELVLQGRFVEIPDRLFFRRDHSNTSTRLFPDVYCRNAWFDPSRAGQVTFPAWRMLREYIAVTNLASLNVVDRLRCAYQLLPWSLQKKRHLLSDLRVFGQCFFTGDRRIYTIDRHPLDEAAAEQVGL